MPTGAARPAKRREGTAPTGGGVPDSGSTSRMELAVSVIVRWASRPETRREIMRRAGSDLAATDAWTLGQIMEHGPLRLSDVAAALGITKASMTARIQRLEAAGLVERGADPSDRRATLLEVSPKGREVFARMHLAHEQLLEEILGGWSDRRRQQVASALAALAAELPVR